MGQNIFTTQTPTTHLADDGTSYTLGTLFSADVDGQVNGIRWWAPTNTDTVRRAGLFRYTSETAGVLLTSAGFVTTVNDGWNYTAFTAPVATVAGQLYVAAMYVNRYYAYAHNVFGSAVVNGNLTAPVNTVNQHNGRYHAGGVDLTWPENGPAPGSDSSYFVDVDFTPAGAPNLTATASLTGTAALSAGGVKRTAGTATVSTAAVLAALGAKLRGQATVTAGAAVLTAAGSPMGPPPGVLTTTTTSPGLDASSTSAGLVATTNP